MRADTVTVSFVVPCYRLAHLLSDCVHSILDQGYGDFEVLVMDDCSPDETPAVAQSFADPRVRHVRNEANLGHLRNYNKGLSLARGRYIWLISADDQLRRADALERYVATLDAHPEVGFVFSPAVRFDGRAGHGLNGAHGPHDRVFARGEFLRRLLEANCVPAPAVMARAKCYAQAGMFPLDLPFAGDWYLWSAFALNAGVAYLAEPMVNYRYHELNMTKTCMKDPAGIVAEGLAVRWRIRRLIEQSEARQLLPHCTQYLAYYYAALLTNRALQQDPLGLELSELEASLERYCSSEREAATLRALIYSAAGDEYYDAGQLRLARERYEWALAENRLALRTWTKYGLLRSGVLGARIRDWLSHERQPNAPAQPS